MPVFAPDKGDLSKLNTAFARGVSRLVPFALPPSSRALLVDCGVLSPQLMLDVEALRYERRLYTSAVSNPAKAVFNLGYNEGDRKRAAVSPPVLALRLCSTWATTRAIVNALLSHRLYSRCEQRLACLCSRVLQTSIARR
jgi:hypothetical protein